ncbi:MAG: hypothetical protein V7459_07080 [Oceanicoccus sp.]
MKKILYFCMLIFSLQAQAQAQDHDSLQGLDAPATKLDVLISSLYGKIGCKVKYSVQSIDLMNHMEPVLCMSDLDYLINAKTIRMKFVVSEGHYLVSGFNELEEINKSKTVLGIAKLIESKIKNTITQISLVLNIERINMEFSIAHKGHLALRKKNGEIKSTKYEVK